MFRKGSSLKKHSGRALRTVALVPARGGSKGLPGKNLAEVGGVSLVVRAIRIGLSVTGIDGVVVSSDDDDVLRVADGAGAMIERRADELSGDDVPMIDVVRSFLREHPGIERLLLLQPTSPLRTSGDVERCLDLLARGATSVATVTRSAHPVEWTFSLDSADRLQPLFGWDAIVNRRQAAPVRYRLNGAVYCVRADHVLRGGDLVGPETAAVVMPADRSVDVDDELGLSIARALASRQADAT